MTSHVPALNRSAPQYQSATLVVQRKRHLASPHADISCRAAPFESANWPIRILPSPVEMDLFRGPQ